MTTTKNKITCDNVGCCFDPDDTESPRICDRCKNQEPATTPKTDLLPCPLKYWWADDEEGQYQGPFDSRELAISDAYCYRAKCFDDPSQDDGFFMLQSPGLLVDTEIGPYRVLAIDVTDEFHDVWKAPSSTRANERDLDINAIKQETHDWFDMCDCGNVDRCEVIDALHEFGYLKHTPRPSPQSEMVAVPREYPSEITKLIREAASLMSTPTEDDLHIMRAEFKLGKVLSMLQPYTKGEK